MACTPRTGGKTAPTEPRVEGYVAGMRLMFITWTTLILTGIVVYSIVGLTHG
jgi:hypothetical protein